MTNPAEPRAPGSAGPDEPGWRTSPRRRAEVALIAALGYPLLRLLGSTWRWRVEGRDHLDRLDAAGQHPIYAFWHGRILPGAIYFQRRGIVVITSRNFDGEWIARIIERFGYGTARGSSSRGGSAALRQLVRDVRQRGVAFTLDGPRGPAEVAQPGALWLSKATGHPLLPFHLEGRSAWTMRSWDRAQIPKPFTTVALAIAEPLFVPGDADDVALEAWRRRLEGALAACKRRCREMLEDA